MSKPFRGLINVDIRDSEPDWSPFEAPRGEDPPGVSTGVLSLFHGETNIGEGRIKTQPAAFGLSGTDLTVGRASSNVTNDFPGQRPWHFTGGTIKTVAVDVSGEPYIDLERACSHDRSRITVRGGCTA